MSDITKLIAQGIYGAFDGLKNEIEELKEDNDNLRKANRDLCHERELSNNEVCEELEMYKNAYKCSQKSLGKQRDAFIKLAVKNHYGGGFGASYSDMVKELEQLKCSKSKYKNEFHDAFVIHLEDLNEIDALKDELKTLKTAIQVYILKQEDNSTNLWDLVK